MPVFEEMGPFAGLMELPSPKHISTKHLAAASNVQQRGGMICPRPGYSRARTDNLAGFTTIKTGLTSGRNVCRDGGTGGPAVNLYFAWGQNVYTILPTGAGFTKVYDSGDANAVTNGRGICIDEVPATDMLYICDYAAGKIKKGDVASGGLTTIVDRSALPAYPNYIAIDPAGAKLYFSENSGTNGSRIVTCTTSGGSLNVLLTITSGAIEELTGLAVDVARSKIYYAQAVGTSNLIRKMTTAGASPTTIATLSSTASPTDVFYDLTNDRIYFASNDTAGSKTISYIQLDSSGNMIGGIEIVASFPSTVGLTGFTVDQSNGQLYLMDTTNAKLLANESTRVIISNAWLRRSLVGASSSTETDDLMLFQKMNTASGGSKFSVYFPARDDLFDMTPGYTFGSGSDPDIWCMISRTANPSSTDPVIPLANYGRASFSWTGTGLDTFEGGMLMAASTGGYVFNYVTGESAQNEIQTITIDGGATGGTFTVAMNGTATVAINYNASAATVQTALRTVMNTVGYGATGCTVAGAAGGPWTVTFGGSGANTCFPLWIGDPGLLTKAADTAVNQGLDVSVRRTQRGRSVPDGCLILRPAGLPTPTLSNAQVNGVTGNLTGVYSYLISYYSSVLNIESPPSNAIEIGNYAGNYATLSWTNPTTHYFSNVFAGGLPFGPVVDRVRIYRKRTGNVLGVGSVGDGVGADATWYFVNEVAANKATYRDNTLDTARTADIYPIQKQYPPDDANYVTINQGRAYYASNSHIVWNSEAKKVGGIDNGELGFEYVAADSFSQAFDDFASDSQITSLNHYEGQLVVATDERLFSGDTSAVDTLGIAFRNVPGAAGCASHWTMVETTPLPGDVITGALLLYFHPKGGMYQYNGSTATPISREDIATTLKTLSPKTWNDTTVGIGDPVSWYYATTVVDGYRNIALTSCPKLAGGTKCMVYDLQTRTWMPWDLPFRTWLIGREWSDNTQYGRELLMFTDGSSIYKMSDGSADDGTPFDWYMTFGRWSLGTAGQKAIEQVVANFDVIDLSGTTPTVAMYLYSGPSGVAVGSCTVALDANQSLQSSKGMVPRTGFIQTKISGTHSDGLNWPALTSLGVSYEKTGLWLK